jgi:hypothetical protein
MCSMRVWLFGGAALILAGCSQVGSLQEDVLEALTTGRLVSPDESGNVVVSCENATQWPVQWELAWEGGGALEPTRLNAQLDPHQSQSVALTGPVFRVWLDGRGVAAIVKPANADPIDVAYSGPEMELGVDFQMGDIITFRIDEVEQGRYRITADVSGGV